MEKPIIFMIIKLCIGGFLLIEPTTGNDPTSHFYPNAGIYIRGGQPYLHHTSSVTIPYIYRGITIKLPDEKDRCPEMEVLRAMLTHLDTEVKGLIPGWVERSHARSKRFISSLLGLASGVTSAVYTYHQIQKVHHRLDRLDMHIEDLTETLVKTQVSLHAHRNILQRVMDHEKALDDRLTQVTQAGDCISVSIQYLMGEITQLASAGEGSFQSTLTDMLSGKLTASVISPRDLEMLVMNITGDETGSLTGLSPLLYHMGYTRIHAVDIAQRTIGGVIILPILQIPKHIVVLKLYTFPIYINSSWIIPTLPTLYTLDTYSNDILQLNPTQCIEVHSDMVCVSPGATTDAAHALQQLLSRTLNPPYMYYRLCEKHELQDHFVSVPDHLVVLGGWLNSTIINVTSTQQVGADIRKLSLSEPLLIDLAGASAIYKGDTLTVRVINNYTSSHNLSTFRTYRTTSHNSSFFGGDLDLLDLGMYSGQDNSHKYVMNRASDISFWTAILLSWCVLLTIWVSVPAFKHLKIKKLTGCFLKGTDQPNATLNQCGNTAQHVGEHGIIPL